MYMKSKKLDIEILVNKFSKKYKGLIMENQEMLKIVVYVVLYIVVYTTILLLPLFLYVRVKRIPSNLKKYNKVIIPSNGMSLKEIADKLLSYNVVVKPRIEDEKLIFQDKINWSSASWGKMYIITTEQNNLTLYYRNALGIYNVLKSDLLEMTDLIEVIVG